MLNEEQIQKVRGVLASQGWTEVMHPVILNRGKSALKALTLSPAASAVSQPLSQMDPGILSQLFNSQGPMPLAQVA